MTAELLTETALLLAHVRQLQADPVLTELICDHIERRAAEVARLTMAVASLQEELIKLREQRARERHTEDMGK